MRPDDGFFLRACPRTVALGWGVSVRCYADVLDDGREATCVDGHVLTREERDLLTKEDR